jgi:Mrp family chromosome partitioning ATPase/uncharacterized protein involved in exopolysaccharide biosynthesis
LPQYELNTRDYLRIFRKRKLIIILTFLAVTLVSLIFIPEQAPVYTASATIKIEERKTIAGLLTEEVVFNPADIMESETKIIKGYPIMKKVALKLGRIKDNYPLGEVDSIVSELQDQIETERIGSTNMIKITATSGIAKEAMDLANTVAQVYLEENLLEKTKESRHARQFIEEQLSSLETRLTQTEDRLKQFRDEEREIKLSEPIQQKLLNLESELAELSQKYTEKYPRVIELRRQIKDLESQLKGFSGQDIQYARLNRELEINKKLYAMLREKLEEARITEAQKIGDVSLVDPAVMPGSSISGNKNIKILIGAIMGLILGVTFAFVSETLDTSIGTIEDVEKVVKLRVLGVIPSIKGELRKGQSFFAKLREKILPVYSNVQEEKLIRLISHYYPKSFVAESYRNIHTNLKLDSSKKTIMITSSGPREGKTNVAINLAIVMAQSGLKTLLVSADLRRPILARAFGIKKWPGVTELVMGTATMEEVINGITDIIIGEMKFEDITRTPGIENISIIPAGHPPSNPAEVLGSKEITNFIEQFKSRFDAVIFDTPPVLLVTDANILAPKMDCVVVVYEIGRTSREALVRTKIQLESVGAKIAGVVLNNTRTQTENIASYPYYHYKYRYYGKEEVPTELKKREKQEWDT